jgi:hypothetical protein
MWIRSLVFALSIALTAAADDARREGHMTPLPSERLSDPITMSCGVTIYEWRGGNTDRDRVEKLCSLATDYFFPYLKMNGIEPVHQNEFRWSMALLPQGYCYRCMNDTRYRFKGRPVNGFLSGYTSFTRRWIFMVGSNNHPDFNVTMVHELFHSMSEYYGVFANHPGSEQEKVNRDEELAEGFTEWLGLGR